MFPAQELATVLAALRFWQRYGLADEQLATRDREWFQQVATDAGQHEPLTATEIDLLCERLNTIPLLAEWIEACRAVSESAEQWADCSDMRETRVVFHDVGAACRVLVERVIDAGWRDNVDFCECELPGPYNCGVPGILARVVDGLLAPGAHVERCDLCERYLSDAEALDKLRELEIA